MIKQKGSSYYFLQIIKRCFKNTNKKISNSFLKLLTLQLIFSFLEISVLIGIPIYMSKLSGGNAISEISIFGVDFTFIGSPSIIFLNIFVLCIFKLITNLQIAKTASIYATQLSFDSIEKLMEENYYKFNLIKTASIQAMYTSNLSEVISFIIEPTLRVFTYLIQIILLTMALFFVSPYSIPMLILLVLFSGKFLLPLVKKKLLTNQNTYKTIYPEFVESLIVMFENRINLIIDNKKISFKNIIQSIKKINSIQCSNLFFITLPRVILEHLAIIIMLSFAYLSYLNGPGNGITQIALIGFFLIRLATPIQALLAYSSGINAYSQIYERIINPYSEIDFTNPKKEYKKNHKLQYQEIYESKYKSRKSLIKLKDVSFSFQENKPYIIQNLNFEIKKGDRLSIVGPSGSGKSTLLLLIMGLLNPQNGILINAGGSITREVDFNNWKKWVSKLSFVPQKPILNGNSFYEILTNGIQKKVSKETIIYYLNKFNFTKKFDLDGESIYKKINNPRMQLSGGEQQRLALCNALLSDANLLIVDEPTSALDQETSNNIMNCIYDTKKTIIIVTHSLSIAQKSDSLINLSRS